MTTGSRDVTIDLGRYTDESIVLLAGQPRGKQVREREKVDALDVSLLKGKIARVIVRVPDYISEVLPSFFIGLFTGSIDTLGEERFKEMFSFEGDVAQAALREGLRVYRLFGRPIGQPNS